MCSVSRPAEMQEVVGVLLRKKQDFLPVEYPAKSGTEHNFQIPPKSPKFTAIIRFMACKG